MWTHWVDESTVPPEWACWGWTACSRRLQRASRESSWGVSLWLRGFDTQQKITSSTCSRLLEVLPPLFQSLTCCSLSLKCSPPRRTWERGRAQKNGREEGKALKGVFGKINPFIHSQDLGDRRPIQTQTSILDWKSVIQMGFLSHMMILFLSWQKESMHTMNQKTERSLSSDCVVKLCSCAPVITVCNFI